jgi:hypothetical protein
VDLRNSLASVQWTNADGSKGTFTPAHPKGHSGGGTSPLVEQDDVHGTASVLPWHRYVITVFEDALVNECGWIGGMPCEYCWKGDDFLADMVSKI